MAIRVNIYSQMRFSESSLNFCCDKPCAHTIFNFRYSSIRAPFQFFFIFIYSAKQGIFATTQWHRWSSTTSRPSVHLDTTAHPGQDMPMNLNVQLEHTTMQLVLLIFLDVLNAQVECKLFANWIDYKFTLQFQAGRVA